MKINKSPRYKNELKHILSFIAKDKIGAMKRFRAELNTHLSLLKDSPKTYRKSIYFETENLRDLTYNGYTIIYEIFENKIEIITIFNKNIPSLSNNTKHRV